MELEEAIKILKEDLEHTKKANECGLATKGEFNKEIEAIEFVLTYITKQEKMIELMAEHISFGEDIQKILCSPKVHKEGACTCITCKRCIKQYFEKKAEEQLTDENKG